MIKKEFIQLYAEKEGIYFTEAQRRIESILEIFKDAFKNEETIIFREFGSFEVKTTTRKDGVNPRTGEPIKLAPKKYVKFKVSRQVFDK